MKNFLIAIALLFVVSTGISIAQSNSVKEPAYSWEFMSYDLGKINKDKPATITFKFKNTGQGPLIINDAKASCGCTVADFSKEPVAPGMSGYIKVTYNAANIGAFNKSLTVTSNVSGNPVELTIKGEVLPN